MNKTKRLKHITNAQCRTKTICCNCGKPNKGGHFVPPSLGEQGFYICTGGLK